MVSKLSMRSNDGRVIDFHQQPGEKKGFTLIVDGKTIDPFTNGLGKSTYDELLSEIDTLKMVLEFYRDLEHNREKFKPLDIPGRTDLQ